jgi:hypothetical protein
MKKTAVLVILFLCSVSLKAQLEVGVKGYFMQSDISLSDLESVNVSTVEVKNKPGFRAGLTSRITILKFYIQPEFVFTQFNAEIRATNSEGLETNSYFLLHRFDVPILVGAKLADFRVFAGPVASFNLNSAAPMFDETWEKGSWNLMAGVGYALNNFELGVYYEWATEHYADRAIITIGDEVYDVPLTVKNSNFGFSVGYFF